MWEWRKEIIKLLLFILLAGILSTFMGYFFPMLSLILLFALIRQSLLITQLEHWLSHGAGGEIPRGLGIWEDIYYHFYRLRVTKKKRKKQLSKILKQFRQSTDVLPDAAVVLGQNDEIEWSNKLAKNVLGLKKSDKGQRLPNLIRQPAFIDYLNNHQAHNPLIINSPVNNQLILQLRLVNYGTGQRLLIAQDVTQQKKMEVMQKNFVANISHELRTPLTVLKGYLETLQEQPSETHSKLLKHSLGQMSAQTDRMQYLVNDLLLLARLETQQQTINYVDIAQLITLICSETNQHEFASRIKLQLETKLGLQGNREELYSAFSNLIINALKYSPKDSTINVIWSKQGEQLCFDVIDNGEGIAPAHISRITERFYRVEIKRDRKINGTGLGLAIVKHVLMRHEAQLEVNSQLGQGSHFRCIFKR
ncbi:MAG: phosphate regulon sensor histidine kinase PhoR [Methylococcales bacterium]|nr:phosphate regulon sensor histidine kinase PhoR [Methylococcales bacterium]